MSSRTSRPARPAGTFTTAPTWRDTRRRLRLAYAGAVVVSLGGVVATTALGEWVPLGIALAISLSLQVFARKQRCPQCRRPAMKLIQTVVGRTVELWPEWPPDECSQCLRDQDTSWRPPDTGGP